MKMYFINKEGARVIDIPNTLESINNILGWDDAWNTPTISIKGHKYIVICSDNGKINHEPISCICSVNIYKAQNKVIEPFIVGPCIITKFDGIDDFTDLTKEDIWILKGRTFKVGDKATSDIYNEILIID